MAGVVVLAAFAIGLTMGFLVGRLRADADLLDRLPPAPEWRTETEYAPQRDPVLDRILDDIERERSADPRQTARDSATSARTKTWRR